MDKIILVTKEKVNPTGYFCKCCGQLRLNLSERKVYGNCGSSDIVTGAVGSLDKESLLIEYQCKQ